MMMHSLTDKQVYGIDRFQSILKLTPLLAITLLVGIESQAVRLSALGIMSTVSDICGDGDVRAVSEFVTCCAKSRSTSRVKQLAKRQLQTMPCNVGAGCQLAVSRNGVDHGHGGVQSLHNAAFAHSIQIRAPSCEG